MAQVIKWSALGVAIAAIIALAVGLVTELNINGFFGSFGTQMNSAVATLGGFFQNVRGAINYLIGDTVSINLYSALIYLDIFIGVLLVPLELTVSISRFINM